MKPVVAAPLPRAAARVRTSSRDAIATEAEVLDERVDVADVDVAVKVGAAGAGGADGMATDGATDGCLIDEFCLLKSSSIACWSAFFKPCNKNKTIRCIAEASYIRFPLFLKTLEGCHQRKEYQFGIS